MCDESDSARTRPGLLVVFSGPSGVGKTTIVRTVRDRLGGVFSVSATTRACGKNESEGVDYYFMSEDAFTKLRDSGELLEHARVFDRHYYGTPRQPVVDALLRGELVILDIDVQGALQVKNAMPEALMIFILPPDEETLLHRLRSRARDDEDAIQRRFAEAKAEIARAKSSGAYDAFIVNDDLPAAEDETCRIISERRANGIDHTA